MLVHGPVLPIDHQDHTLPSPEFPTANPTELSGAVGFFTHGFPLLLINAQPSQTRPMIAYITSRVAMLPPRPMRDSLPLILLIELHLAPFQE
jgi:hypothetical protein